jgi:hypothetical protein
MNFSKKQIELKKNIELGKIKIKVKPLFIHIPKAAGSWFHKIVEVINDDVPEGYNFHKEVSFYDKFYRKECFVFSMVRNPYDRLVSAHQYLTSGITHKHEIHLNEGDAEIGATLSKDFKRFVKKDLDKMMEVLHFRPMVEWLDRKIDFIGKVETYDTDFDFISKKIGLPKKASQKVNRRSKRLERGEKFKHYTEYYDDETRQIVAQRFAKDIEYFGYEFGEH